MGKDKLSQHGELAGTISRSVGGTILHPGQSRQHKPLSSHELRELVYKIRIRIAGFTSQGEQKPYESDVAVFQRLERPFTAWLEALQAAAMQRPTEDHTISPAMQAAIQQFHASGGHAGPMSSDQIIDLMRHGIVAFAELEVRDRVFVTIGSISMRSRIPTTPPVGTGDPHMRRHPPSGLHALWPQYDLRDTSFFPQSALQSGFVDPSGITLLCRTSVLDALHNANHIEELGGETIPQELEGANLRRLGVGGRLKYEAFGVSEDFGSSEVTFNIGTVGIPGQKSLNINNIPSSEHNSWANAYGWRHLYFSTLCPDVHMYWRTYLGKLKGVTEGFVDRNGLLSGKGWDIEEMIESRRRSFELLRDDERHVAWLDE